MFPEPPGHAVAPQRASAQRLLGTSFLLRFFLLPFPCVLLCCQVPVLLLFPKPSACLALLQLKPQPRSHRGFLYPPEHLGAHHMHLVLLSLYPCTDGRIHLAWLDLLSTSYCFVALQVFPASVFSSAGSVWLAWVLYAKVSTYPVHYPTLLLYPHALLFGCISCISGPHGFVVHTRGHPLVEPLCLTPTTCQLRDLCLVCASIYLINFIMLYLSWPRARPATAKSEHLKAYRKTQ